MKKEGSKSKQSYTSPTLPLMLHVLFFGQNCISAHCNLNHCCAIKNQLDLGLVEKGTRSMIAVIKILTNHEWQFSKTLKGKLIQRRSLVQKIGA
jgi:hypothetical protein